MDGIRKKAGGVVPAFDSVREKNTGFSDMERICPDAAVDGGGSCGGDGISAGILENAAELKKGKSGNR